MDGRNSLLGRRENPRDGDGKSPLAINSGRRFSSRAAEYLHQQEWPAMSVS